MRRGFLIFALAALLAGCGGGEEVAPLPETVEGTVPEATTTAEGEGEGEGEGGEPQGDPAAGEAVFAEAGCGSCHTLAAAGTSGTVGPNLDDSQPSYDEAVQTVTNGRGAMPAFADQLSEEEIQNVAAYVVQSTSG